MPGEAEQELEGSATQVETLPPAETEVEPKPDIPEPAEAWRVRAERAEQEARVWRGRVRKQDETSLTLQRLAAGQEELAKKFEATLKAVGTEELTAEVAQIASQGEQARADAAFQSTYMRQWNRLERAVVGKNGEPLFDVDAARARLGAEAEGMTPAQILLLGAPELEAARQAWLEAAPQGQATPAGQRRVEDLSEAVAQAHESIRESLANRHQKALAEAKKPPASAHDLSSGSEAGGGSGFSGRVTEAQLDDDNYWAKHRDAILAAQRAGKLDVVS